MIDRDFDKDASAMIMSCRIAKKFEWEKWTREIPFIEFPVGWKVKAIPPTVGAIIRYWIELPTGQKVSVYLDCYDMLGHFGEPYWEVYPFGGDVGRCEMADTKRLLEMIANAFEESPDEK